jgi:hypothetical protein
MRILSILAVFFGLWGAAAAGQQNTPGLALGLSPKNTATDYELHAKASGIALGVSYMGRSFAAPDKSSGQPNRTRLADAGKFIVLETAVFALPGFQGDIRLEHFALRINGAKVPLPVVSSGFVSYHLQHPDDERYRGFQMGAGMGNIGIGTGGPRAGQERFPGDTSTQQRPLPGAKSEATEQYRDWDAAVESYLPEGPLQSARAGNLFFEYPGKMTKVKQMELLYEGPGGKVSLKLR